nr:uncharacterized protein LOC129384616 [Dermacentor andersoni]
MPKRAAGMVAVLSVDETRPPCVVAKRKKTSSQTASASPVLLLNELEMGCIVDVPQCDQQSDVVSQEPTQLTFGAPASPRTGTEDEKRLMFYTGFNSFEKFYLFVEHVEGMYQALKTGAGRPPAPTMKEQLIAVLCRLRVGLLEQDLAYRLKVSVSTVSAMYTFWVNFLFERLVQIPMWPSRNTVDQFMPDNFKELYPSTRILLDCTEMFIENPSDYSTQSDTFSSYKEHNTAKGLIGITPNGFVSFVSNLAPGRLSDREITRHSGLYELLEEGDSEVFQETQEFHKTQFENPYCRARH